MLATAFYRPQAVWLTHISSDTPQFVASAFEPPVLEEGKMGHHVPTKPPASKPPVRFAGGEFDPSTKWRSTNFRLRVETQGPNQFLGWFIVAHVSPLALCQCPSDLAPSVIDKVIKPYQWLSFDFWSLRARLWVCSKAKTKRHNHLLTHTHVPLDVVMACIPAD